MQRLFFVRFFTVIFLALGSFCFGEISVVPVEKTPEAENARLQIIYPEDFEVIKDHNVKVRIRVSGFTISDDSNFDRAKEIYNSKEGQSIHIILDDQPYFSKIYQQVDPFNDEGNFYETIYEFELPKPVSLGAHTIRAFLCRSFNESLKGPRTYDEKYFYFKTKSRLNNLNLNKPYITYNEPSPNIIYSQKKPVLLDFWLKNCELSKDGYKIKLSIDKDFSVNLTSWKPYYIYGLKKGVHTIKMQLVDRHNVPVKGKYNYYNYQIKVN